MQLGEKIKQARTQAKLSQAALAAQIGVSTRTIQFYEKNEMQPKTEKIIGIATACGKPLDFFLDEGDFSQLQFLQDAQARYGSKGRAQAVQLLEECEALAAGGDLTEGEKDAFLQTLHELFFDAKEKNRARFTPEKFLEKVR